MFTLSYRDGSDWKRVSLRDTELIIGRSPQSGLFLAHPSVSRRHARVTVQGPICRIEDLDSTLHTYVNGKRVTVADLRDGDVLMLGQLQLSVQEVPDGVLLSEASEPGVPMAPGTIERASRERVDTGHTSVLPAQSGISAKEPALARADRLLALLADATGALTRMRNLPEIFERIVALTFEIVPAERVFMLLLDPQSGELVPRVARGRDGRPPGATTISRTVVQKVLTEKTALLSSDVASDRRLNPSESLLIQRVRSFMCATLWTEQSVEGVIYVDAAQMRSFSLSDLDLFTTVANYAAVAIEHARLATSLAEATRRSERLQRYHSPAVAERILKQPGDADALLVAQEREVSVLFADLVGFTRLAETLPAAEVGVVLNNFFSAITDVIFEHEGTLDKYIGDAVLAVFGAPLDQPDHAVRAVRTATGMRDALARLNMRRASQLQMRVAVNSGTALVGDIGTPRRREFTVLGDVVNTAARLQSELCEPGQIVIAEATYRHVKSAVSARLVGATKVKGRAAPVSYYEV